MTNLRDEALAIIETVTMQGPTFDAANGPNPFDPRLGVDTVARQISPLIPDFSSSLEAHRVGLKEAYFAGNLHELVDDIIQDRLGVVSSTEICCKHSDGGGSVTLDIEHCASGLRLSASYGADVVKVVNAKPYNLERVCSDQPVHQPHWWHGARFGLWWARYRALGIGERLYCRVASEAPDRRWPERAGSIIDVSAKYLRAKLHRKHNPFIFEDRHMCAVCRPLYQRDADWWEHAAAEDFPLHDAYDH